MEQTHDDDDATSPDRNVPSQGKFAVNNNDVGDTDGNCMNPDESNAVQLSRVIEKRKIREEIIASESIRHRKLEDEVRMELMIERQIMGMRNFNGFSNVHLDMLNKYQSLGPQNWPNYDQYLLNLGTSDDNLMREMKLMSCPSSGGGGGGGGSDEISQINPYPSESNAIASEGKLHMEEVALGKWPFNRDPGSAAARVAEKSNADLAEEVMAEAMPSAGTIGMKRKAEMPCDEDTTPTMSRDSEKLFCSLCGVSTTSELTMNSHLQGRKHKAKEARFKASDTTPSLQHVSTLSSEQENSSDTKEWDCSLCQVSVTSEALLASHLQGKKHKAKEAKLQTGEIIDSIQVMSVPSSGGNATDSDNQWHCSVCGVSASSENNLNAHLQGKKHKAKVGSTEKGSKIEVVRDKSLDKEDTLKNEEKPDNSVSELSKPDQAEPENKQASIPKDILEVDGDQSVELVKYWHCKMCNKGTRDEATMAAHRKSDEHMTLLRKHGGGLISVKTIPKEVVEVGGMSREDLSA
ncbi:uncharacterized protein LOC141623860 isoform X1 [Silene latifolia]|uniref:uncharacterized protein LOC141623860 isoform X1 n=1 Tax=Silene latifolia TaxID=37657 RepID=UPI003D77EBBB